MKRFMAAAGALALALTLAACGTAAERAPAPVKTETNQEAVVTEKQIILETEGGKRVTLRLNGSGAAKALAAQLPLTVTLDDFSDNEKIFYPPEKLNVENTPKAQTGQPGTLAYYASWGDVVLFYGPYRPNGELYELGTYESAEGIETLSGKATIKEEK